MRSTMWKLILASTAAVLALAHVALGADPPPRRSAGPDGAARAPQSGHEGSRLFTTEVRAILQANCVSCHGGEKPQGGLKLTSREAVLKGGASGPSVSLKKPAESLLLAAVNYRGRRMPPQGKLPQQQIDTLT